MKNQVSKAQLCPDVNLLHFFFGKQIAYKLILQKALEMQLKAIKLVWNETDLAQKWEKRGTVLKLFSLLSLKVLIAKHQWEISNYYFRYYESKIVEDSILKQHTDRCHNDRQSHLIYFI